MNALRSILVHLDGTPRAEARLRLAHQLANTHHAALTALFAVAPRYLTLFPLVGSIPSTPLPADIDPGHRDSAHALFDNARHAGAPTCEWQELNGEPVVETFTERALLCDLMVLGQRHPTDAAGFDVPADFVESVIINSGRPALIVPHAGRVRAMPRTVLVGWKPTRESAHALTAALPLLQQARQVHVVCINEDGVDPHQILAPLGQYLRRHGIEPVRELGAPATRDAGTELLTLAADTNADLLVMGCYGHSRARELILGGATRTILDAMTLPILMAH